MSTMTTKRHLTISGHGAIEVVLGLAIFVAAALLRFSAGGFVAAVVVGSLFVGLGVTVSDDRGASLGWHRLCDLLLLIGTAVLAFALAVAGQGSAALAFSAVAVVQSGLNVATRYVAVK